MSVGQPWREADDDPEQKPWFSFFDFTPCSMRVSSSESEIPFLMGVSKSISLSEKRHGRKYPFAVIRMRLHLLQKDCSLMAPMRPIRPCAPLIL